jgi:hypothetical protein
MTLYISTSSWWENAKKTEDGNRSGKDWLYYGHKWFLLQDEVIGISWVEYSIIVSDVYLCFTHTGPCGLYGDQSLSCGDPREGITSTQACKWYMYR